MDAFSREEEMVSYELAFVRLTISQSSLMHIQVLQADIFQGKQPLGSFFGRDYGGQPHSTDKDGW